MYKISGCTKINKLTRKVRRNQNITINYLTQCAINNIGKVTYTFDFQNETIYTTKISKVSEIY